MEEKKREIMNEESENDKVNQLEADVHRNYKDRLFRMIFNSKKEMLSLYNALNGTDYTDEEQIEVVTLENAIYMGMKNDLAFVLAFELNLYEHQSTFSPNLPLRDLFYIADELRGIVETPELYLSVPVKIPAPRFVVLYNGVRELPERQVLKLSDLYMKPMDEPELELKVTVLNINKGKNTELLRNCKKLNEYMIFVDKVREYRKILSLKEAVNLTVDECIKEGILVELLTKCRNEVVAMCIYEYDEEAVMEAVRKSEYKLGEAAGYQKGEEVGYQKGEEVGYQQGEAAGEYRFAELTNQLIERNRYEDLKRATTDVAYREQLFREFNL